MGKIRPGFKALPITGPPVRPVRPHATTSVRLASDVDQTGRHGQSNRPAGRLTIGHPAPMSAALSVDGEAGDAGRLAVPGAGQPVLGPRTPGRLCPKGQPAVVIAFHEKAG
jgi:hypothetical protein